ncbi:MAG: sigma-54 dependent transcriptional regulator [Xanthomonadales bacterium]|nr:sigma-54 dependent transcriptional regulator [Xanthomonadales bacterium]
MSRSALVVDDEPDIRELLTITLSRMDLQVKTAANLAEARQALSSNHFDFCLTDMRLPDGNGISLVREINQRYAHTPVAVLTAYGKVEDAVQALKSGAFDFVSKPVNLEVLRSLVQTALRIKPNTTYAQSQGEADGDTSRLIGRSAVVQKVRETIRRLARNQAPVLISGDSGSGKELAARLIHDMGPRGEGPFIPVNCGAIPAELMESEFFGHKRGSFTGADSDKEGLFQSSNGGTLFLDEVADLPLHMQVKLLRAIQERTVRPIGARQEIPVDVRIVSATHKSLKPLVESGQFRSDLFFRLNVIELQMPPLRERPDDIPLLAKHFLQQIADQWGDKPRTLSDDALKVLKTHPFPGNVRELYNILQRAIALSDGSVVQAADLQLGDSTLETAAPSMEPEQNLDDYMENVEKQLLEQALIEAKYNKTAAARRLGITFRSLRYKLQKYGIE